MECTLQTWEGEVTTKDAGCPLEQYVCFYACIKYDCIGDVT